MRPIRPVAVPTGPDVLGLLPLLRDALDGTGEVPLLVGPAGPPPGLLPPGPTRLRLGADDAPEDDPDDPTALLVTTSGSSGAPRAVLLATSALAASAAATRDRLGGPGHWLLALPAWHVAGLQVLLRAMADGNEPTVLDTAATFTPQHFAAAVDAMPSGRRYVSLVPTQLLRLLDGPVAGVGALSSFDAVLVGGAAAAPALLDRCAAAGVRVVTTYGMTETCGGCVYDGVPLDGVDVVLDPADGRIQLAGPVVARGYLGRPDDPAFPAPGVFRTGDGGRWTGGRLEVLGRLDDLILTGGHTVAPQPIEAAAAAVGWVAEIVVVGTPDPVWGEVVTAVVVPRDGAGVPDLAALGTGLPAEQRPRRLLLTTTLPRIGPGKYDRREVRRWAAGQFA